MDLEDDAIVSLVCYARYWCSKYCRAGGTSPVAPVLAVLFFALSSYFTSPRH